MNFNGQLWASHLILGCTPVYSTWQPFRQALLVDGPLLSYIDICHPNFLPPNLVDNARDLGPRLTKVESLVLVRDASANTIFQDHSVHKPVKEAGAAVQLAEQVEVESINSFEVEADQEKGNMVTRRTMTMERFIPSARPLAQQQQAPGRDQHPLTT